MLALFYHILNRNMNRVYNTRLSSRLNPAIEQTFSKSMTLEVRILFHENASI